MTIQERIEAIFRSIQERREGRRYLTKGAGAPPTQDEVKFISDRNATPPTGEAP